MLQQGNVFLSECVSENCYNCKKLDIIPVSCYVERKMFLVLCEILSYPNE